MQLSKGTRTFVGVAVGAAAVVAFIHYSQREQRETMKAGPRRDEARYQAKLRELAEQQGGGQQQEARRE
ncbi:MAG: hypothetical protein J3K34DRAFT_471833 [Monoraphidium minutum]|nr:MAG: hypothetical protein J3K34DRAFT_471833 [Monoraphidium minutum]